MRVAVDAMGGDHAPAEIVEGALLALDQDADLRLELVGDEASIRAELGGDGPSAGRLSVRHASERIEMGESPVEALRRKQDTSIQRSMEALAAREVDAVVSAGDTGGVVASATIFCKRLKGVKRHGIAIPLPTLRGRSLLIDVGANIQAKPLHLLQYALMASAYAQVVMDVENPTVGLLSVGEEAGKGTALVKKTRELFTKADLNFVGNVEGQAVFQGRADVIVADGFVGNVVLKVAEGLASALFRMLAASAAGDAGELPAEMAAALQGLRSRLDYSATGGAPLLGVDGCVVICHGRSRAVAIANAIRVASGFAGGNVNESIVEAVAKVGMLARVAEFFHRDQG